MFKLFSRFAVAVLLLLPLSLPVQGAENGLAIDPMTCLECHDNVVSAEVFAASVHGRNACTSCHTDITDLDAHMMGEQMPGPAQCVRCHKQETAEHFASVHMLSGIGCADCHHDIHSHQYWQGDKNIANDKCTECHWDSWEVYNDSIHGQAVAEGKMDSAACFDCHNLHRIEEIGDPTSFHNREFHTTVCLDCHADQEMMARNNVTSVAVSTYMSSYHGKTYRLGYPELVAGCADCHTSHGVFNHNDPRASTHQDNLVATCGACHPGATPLFVQFYSHGDMTDRANYPILYWTFIAMTTLLVSVFAVFWIHTLLWMFRGFVENREKRAALIRGEVPHHIPEAHKIYRRFNRLHIFLHLLVIISFLGLSLTGLPLKFAGQPWAKLLMEFFGGAHNAALIHRWCAVITFVYFGASLVMSWNFLFVRKDLPGNPLQRLFGPDSLFPNLRDVRDITAMVRWFLFLGPKPVFERWTYWEKFDFLAVFWGMIAIGGSGLMLWFPEFFGGFLPGWAFNVATIVHSDEALLATGFIFTVHFFNTHGRPEKFPMDFVIFNGEMNKEEFIHERLDQWKRYEELGITEQFVKPKPSGVVYDFILKTFGFLAVFTGIGLVFLMIYAFMTSGFH
ncbi:doubled CXXCH domain-containing protein [Geoalkalibacter ferrihydriticus]|uniref:C-and b-type cytochrome L n=2 Tax=Geoalkalibacter ferrihydriticus TaxID=392333 RepID=A0A0C2DW34_9BACT|nr:cytochrome c3 family protein [Geoalkalibacter ferrihydriticus]KIH77629.1 c- and b-type cytochrome L [Geoalkalibacter ferrihydriticus DSM 17813]SDL70924.1 doubled CXXCH domain-containing protein [Geoalkalibacter ferrihydriticus]